KKTIINGVEIFELSKNPDEILYSVKFSFVGIKKGNYDVLSGTAIDKTYQYVAPISGIPQGSYEPIIRLIPPTKIQIATVVGRYNPSEKTSVNYEFCLSNNDQNLFSNIDDSNNNGTAGKINTKHRFVAKKYTADVFANYQFVQKDFKTIERLYNIEFGRDWNLTNPMGNQSLFVTGVTFTLAQAG